MNIVDEKWSQLDETRQVMHILHLQNSLECAKREQRMKTARAVLYLAQGRILCYQNIIIENNQQTA